MKNKNAKIQRYLENQTEAGKDQLLNFILRAKNQQEQLDNIGFIYLQIEEYARMYPDLDDP